jgi:hypothetical protein
VGGLDVTIDDFDPVDDAVVAYSEAKERSRRLRAEWASLGSPATALGGSTGKVPVAHPLLTAMRVAEAHEAQQRELLRRRYRGPEPRAVLGGPLRAQRARDRARSDAEPPRVTLRNLGTGGSPR